MTMPYRARLPFPLAENVVPLFPALDRLVLRFGDLPVRVESEATGATAPYEEAVDRRGLRLDGDVGEFDMPVTAAEALALSKFSDLVAAWTQAQEDCDLHGLVSVQARLRKRYVPWWLDVRFEMPARRPVEAIARFA